MSILAQADRIGSEWPILLVTELVSRMMLFVLTLRRSEVLSNLTVTPREMYIDDVHDVDD